MQMHNQTSTSPRATGSPKKPIGSWGAVGNNPKVSMLKPNGGQDKYSGQKTDMKLNQIGGEGGGKEGKVAAGSDSSLLLKKITPDYNGKGRFLGKA